MVDHLFRREYGKMVAVLTRFFGPENLSMAEDVVQDTFIKALKSWSFNGMPANPEAWLHTVARNRAIDLLRSDKRKQNHLEKSSDFTTTETEIDSLFLEHEIPDSQLRMIFMCCTLDLDPHDIIAVTLKVVSGFGVKEIATALYQQNETIKKRIQRARQKLQRNGDKAFHLPNQILEKVGLVNKILYLIFNEGYYSPHNTEIMKKELCLEAMRITKLVCEHKHTFNPESQALLALMCYHASRMESRTNQNHELVLLENQNRDKWDKELIKVGHYYYAKSLQQKSYSVYHLEAAIAAQHIIAENLDTTDWDRMLHLHKLLYRMKPYPSVLLNLIVVLIKSGKLDEAEEKFNQLKVESFAPNPYLYYAVGASLYSQMKNFTFSKKLLISALDHAEHPSEKEVLRQRLKKLYN